MRLKKSGQDLFLFKKKANLGFMPGNREMEDDFRSSHKCNSKSKTTNKEATEEERGRQYKETNVVAELSLGRDTQKV